MKKIPVFILLIFLPALAAFGQSPAPPSPAPTPKPLPSPTPAPSSTPAPSASPPSPETKKATDFKSMVESTLAQDIETASYYELVAWCRLLALDEAGDKPALVKKLKDFFKVQSTAEQKEILRRIEIKSARSSEYFSLEDIKEDYVLIQGDAVILLTDKKDNSTHQIQGERILYNQTTNTLSATGNVVYTRKVGNQAEAFTGETFVFDVSNWEGILYYARGERPKKVDDKNMLFHYSGKTVTRMKDDSILLEKGIITSSANLDNPNYKIVADRIWVYGPGEWSVFSAVLYLGNIPVLPLPFYYYTSDELFFNPVFGTRDRVGAYLENTFYLYGKKKREEGALSFLQLDEVSDEEYEMQLRGLYLHPVKKQGAQAEEKKDSAAAQKTAALKHLKLFLDFYARLGGFAGISLDANPVFRLYAGIGVSRSIFSGANGYTTFYDDPSDGPDPPINYWNSGYFFSLKTPLRFGLETNFDLSWGIIQKITGNLSFFSDPFFAQDFYDREENQDWGKVLGFDIPTQTTTNEVTLNSQRTNLTWTLNLQFNFASLFNSPVLQSLQISPFNFTFEWWSKNASYPTSTPAAVIAADPARMFYYPQRIIFPDFTIGAGGTIAQYSLSDEVKAGTGASPGQPDLRLPIKVADDPAAGTPLPDYFGLRKPEAKQDVPVSRTTKYFTFTLSYALSHQFKMEHLFSQESWTKVEDITYFTKYSTFDHNGSSALNYQMTFWNSMFEAGGGISLLEKYKTTFVPYDGFNQNPATDKPYTSLNLVDKFQFGYSPFKASPDFKDTKLTYDLSWIFYSIVYKGSPTLDFVEQSFQFNRDNVTTQQVTANLVFTPEDKANNLKFLCTIPPVLGRLYGELNFYIWIFQTSATGEYKQKTDDTWAYEPFRFTEQVALDKYFLFSTTYRHNMEENKAIDWQATAGFLRYQYLKSEHTLASEQLNYDFTIGDFANSLTTIDLWNLKATFLAQRMLRLDALGIHDPADTVPQFLFYKFGLSYGYNLPEIYDWKNRIAFTAGVNSALNLDFQKYVDSNFTFTLQFGLKVYQFMDIVFKVEVYNNNVYRYIPAFVTDVNTALLDDYGISAGITPVNPLEDLLRSFNFFNIEDRYNSFFKLKALTLEFAHYMDDWVLKISFSGVFQYKRYTDGTQQYEWTPSFNFSLKWLGIPDIKKEFTGDANGLNL